jgi:hypothetical protein
MIENSILDQFSSLGNVYNCGVHIRILDDYYDATITFNPIHIELSKDDNYSDRYFDTIPELIEFIKKQVE